MKTDYHSITRQRHSSHTKKNLRIETSIITKPNSSKQVIEKNTNQAFTYAIFYCLLKEGKNKYEESITSLNKQIFNQIKSFSALLNHHKDLYKTLGKLSNSIKRINITSLNSDIFDTLENLSIVRRYIFKISTICTHSVLKINELINFTETINKCLINIPASSTDPEYKKIFKDFKSQFQNINDSNELFILDFLKAYINLQGISKNSFDIIDLSNNLEELLNKISKCTNKESCKIKETCINVIHYVKNIIKNSKQIAELIEVNSNFSTKLLYSLNWNF